MAAKRSSYYLSEELIFIVLSYLPVLSLLRCKSVCKTWLSIISNPQFVETHLAVSKKKQASVLKASYNWLVYSLDTPEDSVKVELPLTCYSRDGDGNGMIQYIRSCNGLVCLSDKSCVVIFIWNPCIRQFKRLPWPRKLGRVPLYIGFGFDSIENDYKILRIVFDKNNEFIFVPEVELYSTNADSWKEIRVPKIERSFWHGPRKISAPDINGVLYLEGDGGVVSFDLRNEVFGETGVLSFPNHVKKRSNVLDFEGFAAMIFESVGDKSVLSLWMIDDVCGSWIQMFNFEAKLELNRVYLYLGVEHYVGLNYVFGHKFYDYRKKKIKEFPFPAHLTDVKSVVKYTESLVSLKGFQLQK